MTTGPTARASGDIWYVMSVPLLVLMMPFAAMTAALLNACLTSHWRGASAGAAVMLLLLGGVLVVPRFFELEMIEEVDEWWEDHALALQVSCARILNLASGVVAFAGLLLVASGILIYLMYLVAVYSSGIEIGALDRVAVALLTGVILLMVVTFVSWLIYRSGRRAASNPARPQALTLSVVAAALYGVRWNGWTHLVALLALVSGALLSFHFAIATP
jgi:hypothetical protein